MGFESYISENEAAQLAGIGVSTLRRFAEAGYFKIETEADGLKLYSRTDIDRIFGVKPKVGLQATPVKRWESSAALRNAFGGAAPSPRLAPEILPPQTGQELERASAMQPTETSSTPPQPEPIAEENAAALKNEPPAAPLSTPIAAAPQIATIPDSFRSSPAIEALEYEIAKLKVVNEMNEKFIEMRESEIKTLSDERDWLRRRIERLEEKASRDQLLLLSETQTIKTLISMRAQHRSPVRLALEWLGFASAPTVETPRAIGSAIEVNSDEPVTKSQKVA